MEKYLPLKCTGVISGRGCPFRYIFCASSNLNRKTFRSRSAHNVFQEVAQLVAQGYENVTLLDDDFIFDKDRAFKFADLVEENELKFEWSARHASTQSTRTCCAGWRKSAATDFFVGLESASYETLKLIKKRFSTIR